MCNIGTNSGKRPQAKGRPAQVTPIWMWWERSSPSTTMTMMTVAKVQESNNLSYTHFQRTRSEGQIWMIFEWITWMNESHKIHGWSLGLDIGHTSMCWQVDSHHWMNEI